MRPALLDHLQVFPFWLMDVAPLEGGSIPVLNPLWGFATITAPEVQAELHEVQEGNWIFKRKILKHADVTNVTLTRGATFRDQDFYNWMYQALAPAGTFRTLDTSRRIGPTPRRELLLIHFFARADLTTRALGPSAAAAAIAALGTLAGLAGTVAATAAGAAEQLVGDLSGGAVSPGRLQKWAAAAATTPIGPFETLARVPARAFMLHGCLPVRYKTGTDYDALSGQVSVMELELAVEAMEQIPLTG